MGTLHTIDGRFRVEGKLGEGAYGIAYLAADETSGARVVVKVLRDAHKASAQSTERFRRETVALARLDHPHIVGLLASGVDGPTGRPYYAMPFCPGVALDKIVRREAPLPLERALNLVDQLLDALAYAHDVGIVHRDLKPENLLIERDGTPEEAVAILDFGLAKHLTPSAELGQTLADLTGRQAVGTPTYMAPEQCGGEQTRPQTDIYAVGCILMELLSGSPPFASETPLGLLSQHVMQSPPRLSERVPDAPAALVEAIDACLDKEPDDRPQAAELRAILQKIRRDAARRPTELDGLQRRRAAPTTETYDGEPVRLEEGATLGGYLLEKLLGKGGAGAVFMVRMEDGRKAALKALLPVEASDPSLTRRRFRREVRLLGSLDHPAIPKVYASGTQSECDYALFEFIPGEDLAQRSRRMGPMSTDDVMPIMRQVIPALDYTHARGIVHCDLKPANVRLHEDGRSFLIDLGISKTRAGVELEADVAVRTQEGAILGTFEYLPPEFARGRKDVTPASDVYSLGVLLFECFAGRLPFQSESIRRLIQMHVMEAPPELSGFAPHVPPGVCRVVMACLNKRPQDRFATAGMVLRALEEALVGGGGRAPLGVVPARPPGAGGGTPTGELPFPHQPAIARKTGGFRHLADVEDQGDGALAVAVFSGRRAGMLLHLCDQPGEWLIGRDEDAYVRFAEDEFGVSRRHALLRQTPEGWLFIYDLGSDAGTFVEGARVGHNGLPLAKGATVRLGSRVLMTLEPLERLREPARSILVLRRLDREVPLVHLDGPVVLGRGPEAVPGVLDAERDSYVSGTHCQISQRFGHHVFEDLSKPGTWINGEELEVDLLHIGDELRLGGPSGAAFRLEVPPEQVRPGTSTAPLADSGEPLRAKLDLDLDGVGGKLFLFAGTRLRFGRNRAKGGFRQNDLILRAFPRGNEDPGLVKNRTRSISGHHGTFLVTADGVAVRDDGSSRGTTLDGKPLSPRSVVALPEAFLLEVAGAMALRGRLIAARTVSGQPGLGVESAHPVEALRLERTRDGEHHTYVFLLRQATVGSSDDDALCLQAPGVLPGHARLCFSEGRFTLTALREDAPVAVDGAPIVPGAFVPLEPGQSISLGAARLRFSLATDDDMKRP